MSKAIYDIHKSWKDNLKEGPFFTGKLPERPPFDPNEAIDFLGFNVRSRIGIFSGPLLDAKWVGLAADLGYDLLTYKTIRSFEDDGHPLPNVLYIDQPAPFEPTLFPNQVKTTPKEPPVDKITITNSFGMPSMSPEYLKNDIPLAKSKLKPGQVLILSITGSPSAPSLKDDFVKTALFAKEAGADAIEANFSCPNVKTKEGSLYLSPESSFEVASALTEALGNTPLIVKVGLFNDPLLMTKTFLALSCAGVKAIAGINTISLNVVDPDGDPALGPDRLRSGVCGSAIRKAALKFVKDARTIIQTEKLPLTLIGGGGISEPQHFDEFLNAGADFAFVATAFMFDPYLASRTHQTQKDLNYAHT
ncbi:MAG: dihydroorotate dehydrogenase [Chlamydiia bacterium]|nr:dihydroorotate dehydrogenase [Chlamydiia bacterium]